MNRFPASNAATRPRGVTVHPLRISTIWQSPSSRYTHPSAHSSPDSKRNRATARLLMLVMSAPESISACTGGSLVATPRRTLSTSHPSATSVTATVAGSASVASTFASVPGSNLGAPSSSGRRSAGVPLNPRRLGKMRSPPSSCPVADSFMPWWRAVRGKTYPSR